jgi:hypothetical protein
LADVIISNNISLLEPAKQPPKAEEIKKLYKELWGTAGPSNPIIPGRDTEWCQMREAFPPITDEEIVRKN